MCILNHYLLAFGAHRLFACVRSVFLLRNWRSSFVLSPISFAISLYTFYIHFYYVFYVQFRCVWVLHFQCFLLLFLLCLFVCLSIYCCYCLYNIKYIHHNFATSFFAWIIFISGRHLFYVHAYLFPYCASSSHSIVTVNVKASAKKHRDIYLYFCQFGLMMRIAFGFFLSFYRISYFHEFKSSPSLSRHFRKFSLICELGYNLMMVRFFIGEWKKKKHSD